MIKDNLQRDFSLWSFYSKHPFFSLSVTGRKTPLNARGLNALCLHGSIDLSSVVSPSVEINKKTNIFDEDFLGSTAMIPFTGLMWL